MRREADFNVKLGLNHMLVLLRSRFLLLGVPCPWCQGLGKLLKDLPLIECSCLPGLSHCLRLSKHQEGLNSVRTSHHSQTTTLLPGGGYLSSKGNSALGYTNQCFEFATGRSAPSRTAPINDDGDVPRFIPIESGFGLGTTSPSNFAAHLDSTLRYRRLGG